MFTQLRRAPEPPPLNLLRLPVHFVELCLVAAVAVVPLGHGADALDRALRFIRRGFEFSPLAASSQQGASSENLDRSGEHVGTTVRPWIPTRAPCTTHR